MRRAKDFLSLSHCLSTKKCMSRIIIAKNFVSCKDLRLWLRRFFRERLRGLSPDFRLEIAIFSHRPPRAALFLPVHSEGNLIRVHQVDRLVAELAEAGIEIEVFYADDETEASFNGGAP